MAHLIRGSRADTDEAVVRIVEVTGREQRVAGMEHERRVVLSLIREREGLIVDERLAAVRTIELYAHALAERVHMRPSAQDVDGLAGSGRATALHLVVRRMRWDGE